MTDTGATPEPTNAEIMDAITHLQTTHDAILEKVSGIAEEAAPIVAKLAGSPILKMFGGK